MVTGFATIREPAISRHGKETIQTPGAGTPTHLREPHPVYQGIDADLAAQAGRAVNLSLTLRNWLIGWHIEEYERCGVDRAQYGEKLMSQLADELTQQGVSRCDRRELYRYRTFYLIYPLIVEALPPQFKSIVATVRKSVRSGRKSGDPAIAESVPPRFGIAAKELITKLSFSHFVELLAVEDPLKRAFYETECIRGNWGLRELQRQIASLYFERPGLSRDQGEAGQARPTPTPKRRNRAWRYATLTSSNSSA